MLRWASAVLTAVLLAGLAFALWWVASPRLAEGDRLGFALLVALFGLLSGIVAYGQGLWAGHDSERVTARRAAAELQARRERMEAQLATRRAERDQIVAGLAENPRLTGENPALELDEPYEDARRRGTEILARGTDRGGRSWHREELHER